MTSVHEWLVPEARESENAKQKLLLSGAKANGQRQMKAEVAQGLS